MNDPVSPGGAASCKLVADDRPRKAVERRAREGERAMCLRRVEEAAERRSRLLK